MADTTWKAAERAIAARLRGERTGNTGGPSEDVAHDWLSIEVKTRKSLPAWLADAMAQAVRNAPAGRLPLLILHKAGDRHDNDLAVLRLSDFEEWFGSDDVPF